jgi:hypothetical protein
MASPPRHQNAFALHPPKSVLVSRPLAGLFSILHARAIFPPALRSELQTDRHRIWRRIRATQFLRPRISELPNTGRGKRVAEAQTRHISSKSKTRVVLARKAPSVQPAWQDKHNHSYARYSAVSVRQLRQKAEDEDGKYPKANRDTTQTGPKSATPIVVMENDFSLLILPFTL